MQNEMIQEIEAARPGILVFVNVPPSWIHTLQPRSQQEILGWMQQYVQEHYTLDGSAELGNGTTYRWGEEARSHPSRAPYGIFVFKRTSS